MDLFIFARFHALDAKAEALAAAIRDVAGPTRAEPGCLEYAACRSTQDSRLFWIYSRWRDQSAFEAHAELAHTVRFVERVQPLIDHPLQVSQAHTIL